MILVWSQGAPEAGGHGGFAGEGGAGAPLQGPAPARSRGAFSPPTRVPTAVLFPLRDLNGTGPAPSPLRPRRGGRWGNAALLIESAARRAQRVPGGDPRYITRPRGCGARAQAAGGRLGQLPALLAPSLLLLRPERARPASPPPAPKTAQMPHPSAGPRRAARSSQSCPHEPGGRRRAALTHAWRLKAAQQAWRNSPAATAAVTPWLR